MRNRGRQPIPARSSLQVADEESQPAGSGHFLEKCAGFFIGKMMQEERGDENVIVTWQRVFQDIMLEETSPGRFPGRSCDCSVKGCSTDIATVHKEFQPCPLPQFLQAEDDVSSSTGQVKYPEWSIRRNPLLKNPDVCPRSPAPEVDSAQTVQCVEVRYLVQIRGIH